VSNSNERPSEEKAESERHQALSTETSALVEVPPQPPATGDEALGRRPVRFISSQGVVATAAASADGAYVHEDCDLEKLQGLYGKGANILMAMGHTLGQGLGGRPGGISTCLKTTRKHSTGHGLGFGAGAPGRDVSRRSIDPPMCTSCEKCQWPAIKSRKGKWHCGFCLRPQGGQPRCHACSALTWDGMNVPKTHGREWWCAACWYADTENGPDAGAGGGNSIAVVAELEGMWLVKYPRNSGEVKYAISRTGVVKVGKRRLQLVEAGTEGDVKRYPEYTRPGVYFLNDAHRKDTWEYLWVEGEKLVTHHFSSECATSMSPTGSPCYFGHGEGKRKGRA